MTALSVEDAYFAETPKGLFTARGTWYRTSEAKLEAFAASVLDRVSLTALLQQADRWLDSARTLALWVLPVALVLTPPSVAALVTVGVYLIWSSLAPALAGRGGKVWAVLESVILQFVLYAVVLSLLSVEVGLVPVIVGLAGFVLLRWGVLERLANPLLQPVLKAFYPLPEADQVLRAVVLKQALKLNVPLPELKRMEDQLLEHLRGWS